MSYKQRRNPDYINSISTSTVSGIWIFMMRCILLSFAIISKSLLWIRISNFAQVDVPCPLGAFIIGTRSLLVGRGIGPCLRMPWLAHTWETCSHTDFNASNCVDDNRMRAFCMFHSPKDIILNLRLNVYSSIL